MTFKHCYVCGAECRLMPAQGTTSYSTMHHCAHFNWLPTRSFERWYRGKIVRRTIIRDWIECTLTNNMYKIPHAISLTHFHISEPLLGKCPWLVVVFHGESQSPPTLPTMQRPSVPPQAAHCNTTHTHIYPLTFTCMCWRLFKAWKFVLWTKFFATPGKNSKCYIIFCQITFFI